MQGRQPMYIIIERYGYKLRSCRFCDPRLIRLMIVPCREADELIGSFAVLRWKRSFLFTIAVPSTTWDGGKSIVIISRIEPGSYCIFYLLIEMLIVL